MTVTRATFDAVIFDLFGTLVLGAEDRSYQAFLHAMAEVLGADLQTFLRAWHTEEMRDLRATGHLSTPAAIVEAICDRLGLAPGRKAMQAAVGIRLQAVSIWLEPRSDAIEVLGRLKQAGFRLGLMSDCTAEVPDLFPTLPFAALLDEALFSCQLGMRKPDPRFYALACQRLAVPAERCLYLGDGASMELTGATRAGMHAVLLDAPGPTDNVLGREDAHSWTGARIASLTDILSLVGSCPQAS